MRSPFALGKGGIRAQQILYGGRNLRRKTPQIHMLRRARGKAGRTARRAQRKMLLFAPFPLRPRRKRVLDDVPGRGNGAMRQNFTKIKETRSAPNVKSRTACRSSRKKCSSMEKSMAPYPLPQGIGRLFALLFRLFILYLAVRQTVI